MHLLPYLSVNYGVCLKLLCKIGRYQKSIAVLIEGKPDVARVYERLKVSQKVTKGAVLLLKSTHGDSVISLALSRYSNLSHTTTTRAVL